MNFVSNNSIWLLSNYPASVKLSFDDQKKLRARFEGLKAHWRLIIRWQLDGVAWDIIHSPSQRWRDHGSAVWNAWSTLWRSKSSPTLDSSMGIRRSCLRNNSLILPNIEVWKRIEIGMFNGKKLVADQRNLSINCIVSFSSLLQEVLAHSWKRMIQYLLNSISTQAEWLFIKILIQWFLCWKPWLWGSFTRVRF